MRDTVIVEKENKPAVAAITKEFVTHGKNIAKMEKHPNIKQLVFPYPLEGLPEEELREIADAWYYQAIDLLGVKG